MNINELNELDIPSKLHTIAVIAIASVISVIIAIIVYKMVKKKPILYSVFNLPFFLYPYFYMIVIVMMFAGGAIGFILGPFLALIIHPLIILLQITDAVINIRQIVPVRSMAGVNMVIKLVHIPAYVFHFIIGAFSLFLSVWGIPGLIIAVVIDLATIILSGTHSLFVVISMYKQGKISKATAIICAICSYIYCIDVAVVIFLYCKSGTLLGRNDFK